MGIVGRLGKKERRFLAEILYGFITRDYAASPRCISRPATCPRSRPASFAQAIRAIGEPIHGQPAETISMARLLTLLFEVTELFDMQTRPELMMLQKTMVVVEGVARTLNPQFNMWKAAEPVVGDWIRGNLGPGAHLDGRPRGLRRARPARPTGAGACRARRGALRRDRRHGPNGLRFDDRHVEDDRQGRSRHTRSGRVALWVIASRCLDRLALGHSWRLSVPIYSGCQRA